MYTFQCGRGHSMAPLFDPLQGLWAAHGQGAVVCSQYYFLSAQTKENTHRDGEELINYPGRRPETRSGAPLVPQGAPLLFFVCTGRVLFFVCNIIFCLRRQKKCFIYDETIVNPL